MIATLGVVLFAGSIGSLWAVMPNGQFHSWAKKPGLETLIPLGIVSGLAIGLAMIFSLLA